MAYVTQVDIDDAEGELAELYARLVEIAGTLPNIVKVAGLTPAAANAAQTLYQAVLYADTELSMTEKELVAVVVSVLNGCVYCYTHHSAALAELTGDPQAAEAIVKDHHQAGLGARHAALVTFAEKLTVSPARMTSDDVETLRANGLSDTAVSELVQLVGYFNYTSRLATGLGVDPETSSGPPGDDT